MNSDEEDAATLLVASWQGIVPPNEFAAQAVADIGKSIRSFELARSQLLFEDQPVSFVEAMISMKDEA